MTRTAGLAAVALVGTAAGVSMGVAYGASDGLMTAGLLAACAAAVLVPAHLLASRRRHVGSLTRQFQVGVALVVGVGLIGIGAVAVAMFVSSHDALLVAFLLAFAGVLSAYSASLVGSGVRRDVESVKSCLVAVGEGRRDIRCQTDGADELAELAVAANRMIAQLTEGEERCSAAWAAHRDLIAAVSHDLRTPLTSLQLLSEAIGDELIDGEARRGYARQMAIQVGSLSALVDDLFELSRLQAGDIAWSMQRVRLDELVGETVEAMMPQASASGVAVRAAVPPETLAARASPEKVQRVLFNLVQNAIRHTPPDGSVTVAAESNGSSVEIEVADTGGGVAPSDRERVFEPFYRGGDEAARTRSGAGLGLTICRAIVEAHGGRIWLGDTSAGTRVRFSLPAG